MGLEMLGGATGALSPGGVTGSIPPGPQSSAKAGDISNGPIAPTVTGGAGSRTISLGPTISFGAPISSTAPDSVNKPLGNIH